MTTIAIIGTGRMGTAFAKRLIGMGQPVTVWNRTLINTDAAAKAGAVVAPDIRTATAANIILISLTNAAAVEAVTTDLIAAGISGKLVVDLSTLLPDETETIAKRIVDAVEANQREIIVAEGVEEAMGELRRTPDPLLDQVARMVAAGYMDKMKADS